MAVTTNKIDSYRPEIMMFIEEERNNEAKRVYKQLYDIKPTTRLSMEEVQLSSFGIMQEVGELGTAIADEPLRGYSYTYTKARYAKKATYSSVVLNTDQHDVIEQTSRDLGNTVEMSRELKGMGVFRKAFNAGTTYGDGLRLVATNHPRKDGGVAQANTFRNGVQAALEYSNLIDLESVQMSAVSNSGRLLDAMSEERNKILLVPYTLREEAFQLAGVNGADFRPAGTGDTFARNDSNYLRRGTKYDVLVSKFIAYEGADLAGETGSISKTSASNYWDTQYFIIDPVLAKRYLRFYTQEGYPRYYDEFVASNEAYDYFAYDFYAFGTSHWIWMAGSQGTGAALT